VRALCSGTGTLSEAERAAALATAACNGSRVASQPPDEQDGLTASHLEVV
jgi:hypothetical protein